LADFIGRLKPDTAYLSIPTRPTSIRGIHPVSKNKITEAWELFKLQGIHTELLTGFEGSDTGFTGNAFEDILTISSVHPLREDTLNKLLLKDNASNAVVRSLIHQGLIKEVSYAGNKYYLRNYLDKR
ncbi:MAG: radical SAM protein, partial [Bacteroidota bacterium]